MNLDSIPPIGIKTPIGITPPIVIIHPIGHKTPTKIHFYNRLIDVIADDMNF